MLEEKEEQQQIIKDKIKKNIDYLKNYLGNYYVNLSKTTYSFYKSLNIDKGESCYVLDSDYEALRRFMAYYLPRDSYTHITYDASELLEVLTNSKDSFIMTEVLIINYTKLAFEMGKTSQFLITKLLDLIAQRNRIGLSTVILAEKDMHYTNESYQKFFFRDLIKDEMKIVEIKY
jgi:hypothetical protein